MSTIKTGVKAHDDTCLAAETVRQVAVQAAGTKAAVLTAELAFFRACRKSAIANGLSPHTFIIALQELGVGGQ